MSKAHEFFGQSKVIHMRDLDKNGRVSNFGGVTIVYEFTPDGVIVGLARCSENDSYNKRFGRFLAYCEMLEEQSYYQFTIDNDEFIWDEMFNFMLDSKVDEMRAATLKAIHTHGLYDTMKIDWIEDVIRCEVCGYLETMKEMLGGFPPSNVYANLPEIE